jgi:hypothetical protein
MTRTRAFPAGLFLGLRAHSILAAAKDKLLTASVITSVALQKSIEEI